MRRLSQSYILHAHVIYYKLAETIAVPEGVMNSEDCGSAGSFEISAFAGVL